MVHQMGHQYFYPIKIIVIRAEEQNGEYAQQATYYPRAGEHLQQKPTPDGVIDGYLAVIGQINEPTNKQYPAKKHEDDAK